ncbi:glycosyltransferase family 61 protein [Microvirga sp. BT689]|uniref:glycosyltransferase family 61 protein n=1 Tax=Microvirga arvi TaxID=2778731 RepID=UPI0019519CBA|nr:glycosyltransferase family 61 protein [Microvirga arvi]MBM6583758.1 glycosyltransferase family 61 protein [Microvirga arvi]
MVRVYLKWAATLTGSLLGRRSTLRRLGPAWIFSRSVTAANAELTGGHDLHALFDPIWYLAQYADVGRSGLDPLIHYLEHGAAEGRDPSPLFDTDWYLTQYPDVAESGLNPLVHYLKYGAAEGRDPSPLFDTDWYLAQYPEAAGSGLNPLVYYLKYGTAEEHDPNPLFDTDWYLAQYPNVAESGLNPLVHYLEHGAAEGRDPSPLFDTDWYLTQYPDVAESGLNPLVHYLKYGAAEGRDPNPKDPGFILENLLNDGNLMAASRLFEAMDPEALTGAPVRTIMGELTDVHGFATREGQLLADGPAIEAALSGGVSHHSSLENDPIVAGSLPQPYVAELNDVLVHPGSSTIVNAAGQVLHDEFCRLLDRPGAQPKLPNLKLTRDGKLMIRIRHKAFPALECGVHLCSERAPNYFDWVTDTLPRMLVIEQLGIDPRIPALVPSSLDEIFFELLDFVRHPERPVLRLEEPYLYRVRRLIYPSSPYPRLMTPDIRGSDTGTPSNDIIRALIAQVKSFLADDQRDGTRRLYVREAANQRPKNRELEYFLVTRGFELVNLEGISARARIALFSQASKVVVPLGAEMTDIIWCEPQTQVLALDLNRPNTDLSEWANLAKAANVDLSLTPGSGPQGRNAFSQSDSSTVDLELLQQSVDSLLGSSHQ